MNIFFFGTFNCKADAKGRIMLPITLRKQMESVLKEGFYVKKSYYKECLELYPAQEWIKINDELDQKSRYDEEVDDFIRMFTTGLRQVDLDNTGRLLIPKDVMAMVGIKKEVKISPIRKHLEIWDVETYNQAIAATKERKKELANKVMFGKTNEDVS